MKEPVNSLALYWSHLLVRGMVAIVFGIGAFAWSGLTLAVLILLFGAGMLVDGIFAIANSIRFHDRIEKWRLWLLDGVLGVVVGTLTLFMPGGPPLRCSSSSPLGHKWRRPADRRRPPVAQAHQRRVTL